MMPEKLDSSIVLLRERIEQGMRGSADLIFDEFELAGVKGLAFMFDGLVSNTQVSDFLLRPINRMAPPEADPEKLWEYLRSQFLFSSEQGIVVQGLSNCLVKFSKCCTPVPGDDIVGFITRGYGISVHRADCPNADPARRKPEEAGRWIKVSWGGNTRESYRTTLEVVAKDRLNLIVDISTVLSSTKTHVSSMNARSTPDGFALLSLDIDVADSEQLRSVMRRIEQISGVMRVTRPAG